MLLLNNLTERERFLLEVDVDRLSAIELGQRTTGPGEDGVVFILGLRYRSAAPSDPKKLAQELGALWLARWAKRPLVPWIRTNAWAREDGLLYHHLTHA